MKYYNTQLMELNDKEIMKALIFATDVYEDGDIITTKHILQDILSAIKQFERDDERRNE